MIISQEKKFLFIHIQKTGGKSLGKVLMSEVPDAQFFLGTHDHASLAKCHMDEVWTEYYKFAFVRNPWDRLVSWYTMITQRGRIIPWYERIIRLNHFNHFWQYILKNSNNFESFLRNCTGEIEDIDGKKSILYNQLDYIRDKEGRIIIDFIGRYENLESDSNIIFQKLGLDNINLPQLNISYHPHYSKFYTDETAEIVAKLYSRDIEFFGYTFEEYK